MGVSKVPNCFDGLICGVINFVAKELVYFSIVQNWIGPAGYFRNPSDLVDYVNYSVFLPYVNGEKQDSNTEAVYTRFSSLNAALFVMFSEDTIIYPKETAWFSQIQADGTILPVNQTSFYQNDLIGFKTLD